MIRSPIKWVGGKYKLRKKLISMLPPHQRYVEVFAGAAWVLFGKEPSESEVFNDIHPEVVNFFRVVRKQPEELIHSFRWALASREEFERLRDLDPMRLDPIARAHRFFYLVMAGWGGELHRARFQTSISDCSGGHGNRLIGALKRLDERILLASRRLQDVIIEQQDWRACVDQYDDENTVMYLDPPYPNNNCNYEYNMRSMEIHRDIAERMKRSSAKFLLTTYDRPEVIKLFLDFDRLHVEFPSGMPSENGRTNKEIIVTNYEPASIPLQLKQDTATRIHLEISRNIKEKYRDAQNALARERPVEPRREPIAELVGSLVPGHDCYVEMPMNNRMVLPGKPPSLVEVLNDIDGEVVNLFRAIRQRQEEFLASLDWALDERPGSSRQNDAASGSLGEIARARDFYLQNWHDQFPGLPVIKTLEAIHARLQTVIIERLPWEACADRYNDERTVICMNLGNQQETSREFCKGLAQRMRLGKARFIVVTCEQRESLQLFSELHVRQKPSVRVLADGRHESGELVITNFDPDKAVRQKE